MYFKYPKHEDPEITLFNKIKRLEIPYVEVLENFNDGSFECHDENGKCIFQKNYRFKDIKNKSLQEIIDDPQNRLCKILIATPTEDFPYWLDIKHQEMGDDKVIGTTTKYFRVAVIKLSTEAHECVRLQDEKLKEEREKIRLEELEYQKSLIDETNYKRRYILIKKYKR